MRLGRPAQALAPPPAPGARSARSDRQALIDHLRVRRRRGARYAPSDIIQLPFPRPDNPYFGGYSPLAAAIEKIRISRKEDAHLSAMLENMGRPGRGLVAQGRQRRAAASAPPRPSGSAALSASRSRWPAAAACFVSEIARHPPAAPMGAAGRRRDRAGQGDQDRHLQRLRRPRRQARAQRREFGRR